LRRWRLRFDARGRARPDIDAPVVALAAPAQFASGLTGTIALSANASDNVGVTSVEFQIDGVPIGAADTSAPYATTLDTSAYPSGQHVLRVRASDAAGNVSAWTSATVSFGGAVTQPAGFTRNEAWITGLANATAFAQAPDGRLFVAEQGGTLRVVKNGALLATPFVSIAVDSNGERGLIGVTLSPTFANDGFVYVYSTRTAGGAHNRISRFTAAGDVAAGGSETTLVDLPLLSGATNHNGGGMHFGPDGKLYVGVGENANPPLAQDLSSPFGKLLRFNADGTIPNDNPFFATQAGIARAVWALRSAQSVHLRVPAGHRHAAHQRRRPEHVGGDRPRQRGRELRLAEFGRSRQHRRRHHRAAVRVQAQRSESAGVGTGRLLRRLRDRGRRVLSDERRVSGRLPRPVLLRRLVSQWVARLDLTTHDAYAFAKLSAAPVDMLVGNDGALYVLTRTGVTRISSP
jgi:glucose/arabinose dehydrogenase